MARAVQTAGHPRFSRKTLRFLEDLAANNERTWFEANRHRYETLVLDPALAFIESMAPGIERLSKHFVAIPKRTGGSLMRVYRDTRFSRDKTPYKTNIGIQFRHERGRDVHAPGFYLHIEPRGCFAGAGIWHPDSGALSKIRQRIAENGAAWRRATRSKRFTDSFTLGGRTLVRPPRGFGPESRDIDDIKRQDFIAVTPLADREVLRPELAESLAATLRSSKQLMAFLCAALELPF